MSFPNTRRLDAGTRMGEVLFGLIMTLTFTLGAKLVIEEEGREGVKAMLVAILGCNLAWGIIDGVLYVLGRMFERGRIRRAGVQVRQAPSEADALQVVSAEMDEMLVPVTDERQRQELYRSIVQRLKSAPALPNRLQSDDLVGGLASGLLVFACSFPAIVPFIFLDDLWVASRVSNAILIALLFLVGYRHARSTLARPWLVGTAFMLAGVFLVAIAIPLGG